MVSPELIRRYPFFAGLSRDHLVTLAKVADEVIVDTGHFFFHEGDDMLNFFLVVEGAAAIVMEVPAQDVAHKLSDQFSRKLQTQEVVISPLGPGDVFGWSGLVPPHKATASGKAVTPCRVLAFNCLELREAFEEDCRFGFLMMHKVAQVIRERLHASRIESLAQAFG